MWLTDGLFSLRWGRGVGERDGVQCLIVNGEGHDDMRCTFAVHVWHLLVTSVAVRAQHSEHVTSVRCIARRVARVGGDGEGSVAAHIVPVK